MFLKDENFLCSILASPSLISSFDIVNVQTEEGAEVMLPLFPGIIEKIQQTVPARKAEHVAEGFQWTVGAAEDATLPRPAEVPPLCPL